MQIDFGLPAHLFATYFSSAFFGVEALFPVEAKLCPTWDARRVRHFSTGRYCARQTLLKLGYEPEAILIGSKREPLWPEGIAGSISHTDKLVGAVVAEKQQLQSIGLDIETIGQIQADMWELIFTPTEQQYLNNHDPGQQAWLTTALFSVKEAYYKMQYPITGLFLDYTDVAVTYADDRFSLKVVAAIPESQNQPPGDQIYYARHADSVVVVCFC